MRDEKDEIERQLKQDLRRVPAPEGFADRVMECVAKKERLRLRIVPQRSLHVWQVAIAAAALIAVLFGGVQWMHRQQERRQAEIVQQQFDVAMQVTERTLDGVGERISQAGTKREKEKR